MKGEWCYFENIFTPEECQHIINEGLQLPNKQATLGVEGSLTDNEFRSSIVRFFEPTNPTYHFIHDKLWKYAITANHDWFKFNINRLPYIQLAEYDESYKGHYRRHIDTFWMNDDPIYHRKLTCVVQLTNPDNYEGGNLELYNVRETPDVTGVRKQGTAIFFPGFIEHQANPVTKGRRYSLAAWFEGPKFV